MSPFTQTLLGWLVRGASSCPGSQYNALSVRNGTRVGLMIEVRTDSLVA